MNTIILGLVTLRGTGRDDISMQSASRYFWPCWTNPIICLQNEELQKDNISPEEVLQTSEMVHLLEAKVVRKYYRDENPGPYSDSKFYILIVFFLFEIMFSCFLHL